MDETHRPPNKNNGKKRKKRKRTVKKSTSTSSDDDGKSTPSSSNRSDNDEHDVKHKDIIKTTDNTKDVKVRSGAGGYPYPTDYNDHFETPARAYDDIYPLLEHNLAKKQQKSNNKKKKSNKQPQSSEPGGTNETVIYDPYYCAGRAATLLDAVFQRHKSKKITSTIRIQHEKRDFYHDVEQNTIPKYDILITNPPYSGDHKERCLEFSVNQLKNHGRPFFLLMPNYVATKDYFRKIVLEGNDGSKKIQNFYISPPSNHQYEYDHPEGTGHQVSPFASVWFCGMRFGEGKTDNKAVMDAFARFHSSRAPSPMGIPQIATSLQELIRMGGVSGEKRKNPRQRKKMRQQAMQRANNAAAGGGSVGNNAGDNGGQAKSGAEHGKEGGRNNNKRRKFKK